MSLKWFLCLPSLEHIRSAEFGIKENFVVVFCFLALKHLCGQVEQAALGWWCLPCWQGLVADLTMRSHHGGSCFLSGNTL